MGTYKGHWCENLKNIGREQTEIYIEPEAWLMVMNPCWFLSCDKCINGNVKD